MIINDFLHEALVDIGIIWSVIMILPALAYIARRSFRKPFKRLLVWVVRKLDRAVKRAEMRRIRRKKLGMFHLEQINGTSGYRIRTR